MRQIDADDLKAAFDTTFFNDEDDYKRALRIIDNAPTVMNGKDYDLYMKGYKQGKKGLDRPKGEWVMIRPYKYKCDICECETSEEEGLSNFCPDCGADMRGGVENES